MQLEARAKINWTLDILGQREDGYHLMDMLMQPVTLSDQITLEAADELTLATSGFPRLPPTEDHLALRAARALQQATQTGLGARMSVHKRIPVGAGMGGGSADAAAVLLGLNRLWQTDLPLARLEEIGLTLGADVPFCLRGGLTRTTGVGEIMRPVPCARLYWLTVVQPCKGLSTRDVFAGYHLHEDVPRPATDDAQRALASGDLPLLCRSLGNVLAPVSERLRPEISAAVLELKRLGASCAQMSGSGSAVFGVFRTAALARTAAESLRPRWRSTFMCHTCAESVLYI